MDEKRLKVILKIPKATESDRNELSSPESVYDDNKGSVSPEPQGVVSPESGPLKKRKLKDYFENNPAQIERLMVNEISAAKESSPSSSTIRSKMATTSSEPFPNSSKPSKSRGSRGRPPRKGTQGRPPKSEAPKFKWIPGQPLPKPPLLQVLDKLQKKDIHGVFAEPVDGNLITDYYDIIKNPMDYGTMRTKIANGEYKSWEDFESDIVLICENAMRYNQPTTIYHRQARAMRDMLPRLAEAAKGQVSEGVTGQRRAGEEGTRGGRKSSGRAESGDRSDRWRSLDGAVSRESSSGFRTRREGSEGRDSAGEPVEEFWKDLPAGGDLRRPFVSVDSNRRASYAPRLRPMDGFGRSTSGETRTLAPTGGQPKHAYALSLAIFAANLSPAAWDIASRKIQDAVGPHVRFGRGWVGRPHVPAELQVSVEKKKASTGSSGEQLQAKVEAQKG